MIAIIINITAKGEIKNAKEEIAEYVVCFL